MNDRINIYRHKVKAIKSEWGVDYIITGGLGDPREARKRKMPVYGPGQVGREAVNALVAAGTEVRVLVRSLSSSSVLHGVQVVQGSFEDDASLTRAFDGIDTMFLAGRDSPDTVSQQRRVLTHARHVNVQHIVKLSAIGASPDSPIALMRDHHAIDEEIQAGPTNWTLLKPHLYMQNLLRLGDAFWKDGLLSAPMGQDYFPLVDTRDVGAAAATVLGNPSAHAGESYALTGPVAHTYDEVATALSVVTGRAIAYEPVPPQEFEAELLMTGTPDWRAFDLAHISSAYDSSDNVVSSDLAMLLGRRPRSLSEFLQDHRDLFTGVRPRTTNK